MELTLPVILPGMLIWISILLLPWQPWRTGESLDSSADGNSDLDDVTVLIPARNEALTVAHTLRALKRHCDQLKIIVIDDQSTDDTVEVINQLKLERLSMIPGTDLPAGWSGKLWALEQGLRQVKTPFLLLLDADIVLKPGLIAALLKKARDDNLTMVSLMARLKMQTVWEKLLLPAFIFFFKLLYPFQLANRQDSGIAAAAGGCILLEAKTIRQLGGFGCIKNALIDDCTLAKRVKSNGHKTWTGLTHSAISIRSYDTRSTIWQMVARTAYTQLCYSPLLLMLCTVLMIAAFIIPVIALFQADWMITMAGLAAILLQVVAYIPTLRYYDMSPIYALSLPVAGTLYLLMTWSSAYRYYFSKGANWKGRYYN